MVKLSVGLACFALVATAAAQERIVQPVGPDCLHYLDGKPWYDDGASGGPGGGNPGKLLETYDVTHAVGSQVPTPQCFLIYDPSLPGAPDDIVTVDGIPETTRTDVFGTVPTVNERESPPGPPQSQIEIQTSALPGQQLFPGGLLGPQHQPLIDACFYIGLTDPLMGATPRMVVQAFITFSYNGTTVAGPYDVTSFFSNPWNGFFGASLPGGAGSPLNINGVNLHIVVMSEPPCVYDSDCDDGDQCTVDKCVLNVCVHTPLKDTLTRERTTIPTALPTPPIMSSGWLVIAARSANPTAPPPMPGSLGNVNGLGGVNGDDIAAFVACLTAGGPPSGPCLAADIDQNGVLDLGDVPGFVLLLLVLN